MLTSDLNIVTEGGMGSFRSGADPDRTSKHKKESYIHGVHILYSRAQKNILVLDVIKT
jgi:hypothetical protein